MLVITTARASEPCIAPSAAPNYGFRELFPEEACGKEAWNVAWSIIHRYNEEAGESVKLFHSNFFSFFLEYSNR